MSNLTVAIQMAAEAHHGQVDKAGEPYILHPLRVMLAQDGEVARIVGVLHDVVEDSDVDLTDIAMAGFAPEVTYAIDSVTRREGEDYFAYVRRAKGNPVGRLVKLADLKDNLRPGCPEHLRLRYGKALDILTDSYAEEISEC